MTYRILITGSRDWRDPARLTFELGRAIGGSGCAPGDVVIIHGACPRGADRMAADLAVAYGYRFERYPAGWEAPCVAGLCKPGHRRRRNGKTYCPAAGNYRNQVMVDLGADICLAFIRARSPGATDCAGRAERAGITVRRFTDG